MSELRVDKIINSSGSGSVEFSQGISIPAGQTLTGIAQTAESLTATASVNTVGIITATTFSGNLIGNVTGTATTTTNLSDAANITTGTINAARLSGTYNINVTGNVASATYATNSGVSTYAVTAGVATALQNARTFEITGDVVASKIIFDGTGNVSLAATIQPNSVELGTDTTGDYVQTITGTSNQIAVTGGTGESSTPTLSIPNQFTAPQDVTVIRDLQVNRNLNVNGNITIGGTSATIFSQTLSIYDPDIVLGYRTDAFGNDVSNDNTANHGGIAIASTEGTPLTQLFIAGIETNPATYKKIMWFKAGTFAGLGTDAWLTNYAVGIGSTQVPNNVRLAAGAVQFSERDLIAVRDINSSGVVTATTFTGSGTNLTGIVTSIVAGTGVTISSSTGAVTINSSGGGIGFGIFNSGISSAVSARLTGLGATVLTLPSTSGREYIVHSISAANIAIGNTEMNVIGAFDFNGGERSYFAYNIPIPTGTSVELLQQPQVLNPSDRIVMRATDINRVGFDTGVEVYITYQEVQSTSYFGVGLGTVAIASTSPTTAYTATSPSVVQSIRLANRTDTGAYPISVTVTSGVTTISLVNNLIVPKYASVELLENPQRLNLNDVLRVQSGQAQTIDIQVSGIVAS